MNSQNGIQKVEVVDASLFLLLRDTHIQRRGKRRFQIMSRNELKKSIEDNGGKVSGSISKKTTYIIAGDNMGPSKREKAESLGIPMISEQDYLSMI